MLLHLSFPRKMLMRLAFPRKRESILLFFIIASLAGCASGGAAPESRSATTTRGEVEPPWNIKTREHIDLWFHAFAMLHQDTSKVPFFRGGYRAELTALRMQRNITTRLDENRTRLVDRLGTNQALINSQFLAIYFANWSEMKQFMDMFTRVEGDPERASNISVQRAIAIISRYFPSAADRDWARLFMQSVDDEYERFYHAHWLAEEGRRKPVLAAIDTLWRNTYYPRFKRYLDGSQQRNGDLILSLPLDGEGRLLPGTVSSPGSSYSYLAINYPDTSAKVVEAIFVFAHEVSGRVVNVAVSDHTTPAEARSGLSERYESDGLVVGGYFLIKRVAPELAEDYARYYLRSARVSTQDSDAESALMAAFPLPQLIRESIVRQINIVLGGI